MAITTRSRKTAKPRTSPPEQQSQPGSPTPIPCQSTPVVGSALVPSATAPSQPTDCRDIPLDQLKPNPAAGRHTLRGIEELADSIRQVGILQPLGVRADPGPSSDGAQLWMIVMGERRYAAAQLAGLPSVPCVVRSIEDEAQAVQEALLTHLHQQNLSPVEEAEQLQRLMNLRALSVADLATAAGRSPSFVGGRLALLALPPVALDALHNGLISVGEAVALTDLADYPEQIDALLEDIDEDGIDPYALKTARQWATTERELDRLRAEAQAKGLRLIEIPPRQAGYVFVANLDLTGRQVAAHARQSCHGVYLETSVGGPRLVPICSDPDRHATKAAPAAATTGGSAGARQTSGPADPGAETEEPVSAREDARQEQQARARAEAEERERVAKDDARNRKRVTSARKDFLAQFAGKKTPKRSEALVFVLGSIVERASQATMMWVGGILGLEAQDGGYGISDWRTPVATYAAASGENLLKVACLISAHWAEERINPHTTGYNEWVARYIHLLAAFGYTPDPYEVEQIERARQSDIEANPDAGPTNGGGDAIEAPQDGDQDDTGDEELAPGDEVRQITNGTSEEQAPPDVSGQDDDQESEEGSPTDASS